MLEDLLLEIRRDGMVDELEEAESLTSLPHLLHKLVFRMAVRAIECCT